MAETGSIYDYLPIDQTGEAFSTILEKGGLKVERIISTGQSSPAGFWYDQEQAEWVIVLEGRGVVEFEDGQKADLQKGDYLYIAPRRRHRVTFTAPECPTLWLAVHFDI